MAFRKIRPSFGDSSASISTPSQSTSESTGSDLRRNRGDKEGESVPSTSKRRRVPDSVTRNACLNCKKARAKVCGCPHLRCVACPRDGRRAALVCAPFVSGALFSMVFNMGTNCRLTGNSVMERNRARDVRHGSRPLNVSTRSISSMRRRNWSSRSRSSRPGTI